MREKKEKDREKGREGTKDQSPLRKNEPRSARKA